MVEVDTVPIRTLGGSNLTGISKAESSACNDEDTASKILPVLDGLHSPCNTCRCKPCIESAHNSSSSIHHPAPLRMLDVSFHFSRRYHIHGVSIRHPRRFQFPQLPTLKFNSWTILRECDAQVFNVTTNVDFGMTAMFKDFQLDVAHRLKSLESRVQCATLEVAEGVVVCVVNVGPNVFFIAHSAFRVRFW